MDTFSNIPLARKQAWKKYHRCIGRILSTLQIAYFTGIGSIGKHCDEILVGLDQEFLSIE